MANELATAMAVEVSVCLFSAKTVTAPVELTSVASVGLASADPIVEEIVLSASMRLTDAPAARATPVPPPIAAAKDPEPTPVATVLWSTAETMTAPLLLTLPPAIDAFKAFRSVTSATPADEANPTATLDAMDVSTATPNPIPLTLPSALASTSSPPVTANVESVMPAAIVLTLV